MLARPLLFDFASAHRIIGPLHPERADVDMR